MLAVLAIEAIIPDKEVAATIGGLWCMVWFVSILAVATKRLHDLELSGLTLLVFFLLSAA